MFKNKKGFGDAVSALILFIAVLLVSAGVVVVLQNYVFETQESIRFQSDTTSNQLNTLISITNTFYNDTDQTLYVYLKNIGKTKLNTQNFDVFVNGQFISEYNVTDPSDFTVQRQILDVQQTVAFVINISLGTGSNEVRLVSEYGGRGTKETFNI